ncbi:MAG: class I SAM-dependent methyltransferase [Magnetococcus sp. DMHC-6]
MDFLKPTCLICGGTFSHFQQKIVMYSLYSCADCGLEFLYPQPQEEVLANIYGQNYYNSWGMEKSEKIAQHLKWRTFQMRLDLVAQRLSSGARILDLGCATGYFLDVVKKRGFAPYGVELSEFGANLCKSKFGEGHIFCGELHNAVFSDNLDGKFEAIFMSDFLEHVRNPAAIIEQASQLLSPRGKVVITTPTTEAISKRLFGKSWPQYKIEHLFYFNRTNLVRLLKQYGFEPLLIIPARKAINLSYLREQFMSYPHSILTPIFRLLGVILPEWIKELLFTVTIGEMVVVAENTNPHHWRGPGSVTLPGGGLETEPPRCCF